MAKRERTKRQTTIHHVSTKALITGRRIHTYVLAICVYNVFSVPKGGISRADWQLNLLNGSDQLFVKSAMFDLCILNIFISMF
jgi:hypothetical protein